MTSMPLRYEVWGLQSYALILLLSWYDFLQ